MYELDRAGRSYKQCRVKREAASISAIILGWLLLWHLADVVFILAPSMRQAVSLLTSLMLMAGAGRLILLAFRKIQPAGVAKILEQRLPHLRQDVSTVLQWRMLNEAPENYSRELVAGLEQGITDKLEGLDFSAVFPAPGRRSKYVLWGLSAIWVLLMAFTYTSVELSFQRYLKPAGVCGDWSQVIIEPGNTRLTVGQDLSVIIAQPKPAWGGAFIAVETRTGLRSVKLADSSGVLVGSFGPADSSFGYRIVLGRKQSQEFRADVYRPLMLGDLGIRIIYPAYAGIPPYSQENDGNLAAVKGSSVILTARANQPLSGAGIIFEDGRRIEASRDSSGRISLDFSVSRSTSYRFWAASLSGDTLMNPAQNAVTMMNDDRPTVKLNSPEDRSPLGPYLPLLAEVAAGDDYGLERIELHIKDPLQQQVLSCSEVRRGLNDTMVSFVWRPKTDCLLPGDSVLCWAEVWDNDRVSGPKKSQSQVVKLLVPSNEEIYRRQSASDSAAQQELSQAQERNRSLKQEMERLSQSLKENRQMDWQQKAAVEEALKNQEQLVQKMEKAAREARQQAEQNTQGMKFDLQTMEKLAELSELFQQVATEEMRKALEQMQQALEKMDRRELDKALENIKFSQEEFQQRLDAAIAGLKDLQQEQMLTSLKQEVDEMARQQKSLMDASDKNKQDAPEQARRQRQLADDLESVQKRMEELSGPMQERNSQAAGMMRQAGQKSRQQQTSQKMRRAGRQMEDGQGPQARPLQQEALVDLTELSAGLQHARNNMGSQRSKEASRAMRQKAGELVELSRQQEELNRQMKEPQLDQRDLASRQQILQRQAARIKQRLDEMTRRHFMLSPQAGQAMQEAIRQMGSSGQSLAEGHRQASEGEGRAAQSSLNQAAMALIQSASRSGGGSGSGDMMQDLDGLSGMQQNINQASQGLMPMPGGEQGGLSQQARSQMARLAAEQEAVRQGLENFNREYGRRGDKPGRLDDLVSEMERVIRDLKDSRMDRQTVERQEKILARMLSTGSSLKEKETSQQRQAEPGKEDITSKPVPRPNPGQPDWRSAPELKNWRSQPYPLEYRELLEEYFRLLGQ